MNTIIICLLSLGIILFETSFVNINILRYVSFLFIIINLLYWNKRYKIAIFSGVISCIIIDLILQNNFGKTMFSMFVPILLLSFLDVFLKLEGRVSRIVFSVAGTLLSLFLFHFLFDLLFLKNEIDIALILKKSILSVISLLILSIFIEKMFPIKEENKLL